MDRLLNVKEVAEHLGVSQRTVHRLIQEGTLASHRVGRSRRISAGALRDFVKSCESSNGN